MKAVVLHRSGGPDELRLEEVADPEPAAGEVRIAVIAAGTNPVDAGNRADGSWARIEFPFVPGYDVAGVIDVIGAGVIGVSVGPDQVRVDLATGNGETATAIRIKWPVPLSKAFNERPLVENVLQQFFDIQP